MAFSAQRTQPETSRARCLAAGEGSPRRDAMAGAAGNGSRAPAEGRRRSFPSQPQDPAKEAALTFGPSQHKPESLMLPLLQHGRLLLNDVVTGQERAQENDAGVRFQHHAARRRWPSCLRQGDLFSSTVSSQQGVGHNLLPSLPCPESEQKDESYFPSTCRWRKAPAAWITLVPTGPLRSHLHTHAGSLRIPRGLPFTRCPWHGPGERGAGAARGAAASPPWGTSSLGLSGRLSYEKIRHSAKGEVPLWRVPWEGERQSLYPHPGALIFAENPPPRC